MTDVSFAPSSPPPPDLILYNGQIRLSASHSDRVEALAARDGRIIQMGSSADLLKLAGPETRTQLVDLKGRTAIPGLIDAHCHAVRGCVTRLFSCTFPATAGPEDIESALNAFLDANPNADFIMGGRHPLALFTRFADQLKPSPREWLDARSRGKAIYFREESGHSGWCNSRALDFLGINKDFVDPSGGTAVRDPVTGLPNGVLLEEVDSVARLKWPDFSADQWQAGVIEACRMGNELGLTGFKDANADELILRALKEVDSQGKLTAHVAACIGTLVGRREVPLDYDKVERTRDAFASKRVATRHVKFYLDGVPLSDSRTACMCAPYSPSANFPENHRGHLHIPPDILAQDIAELDRRGFSVKMHACGDASVAAALDAVAHARKVNGPPPANQSAAHEVAHAGFVAPGDAERFVQLGVTADLSPYIWYPSPLIEDLRRCLGDDRVDAYFPVNTFLKLGVPCAGGSDWPVVGSWNPWLGIAGLVTRKDPSGKTPGSLGPEEAVSIEEALALFTEGGAKAIGKAEEVGKLEVGRWANVVVLNQDVFSVDPSKLGGTKADVTVFEGRVVYERGL